MTLLKPIFLLAVMFSLDQEDVSLRVQTAVPPARPVYTLATGLVVAEVGLNQTTGALQTRVLHGDAPFIPPALDVLKHWRFVAPPGVVHSHTSVTFLFRSPTFYSMTMGAPVVRPWMPDEDCPALPQRVTDPGYPSGSLSTGGVILELRVNAAGVVTGIETISGIGDLTEHAKTAVKKWQFSPAMISGKPAPSTAYVVVSFVLPT